MSRLPVTATKAELREAHVYRMHGKKIDRARRAAADSQRTFRIRPASINRHTGKPHEHARERMRRTMSPLARRAFAAAVAANLAAGEARKAAATEMAQF